MWNVHIICVYVQHQVESDQFTVLYKLNDRAMLLKPEYELPVDSTEELIKRGIVPINSNGGFWEEYLLSSANPWERLAGERGIKFESGSEQQQLIREKVKGEGTHASLENTEAIAYLSLVDPLYKARQALTNKILLTLCSESPTSRVPSEQGTHQTSLPRLGLQERFHLEGSH